MTRRPRHRGPDGRFASATPGVIPGKRSVSVSEDLFRRAKEYAVDNDVPMAWIVDEAVAPVLAAAPAEFVEMVPAVAVPMAARRPSRARPAPPPERPIPFWLLPTGPIRRNR